MLENPQFRAWMMWRMVRVSASSWLPTVVIILSRTDMTNSRSVAHSDVDISSWVEPLHHFPERYLKSSTLLVLSRRNSDQFPGILTFWKGTPQTSRQRHDSGIFSRKSNFAVSAWNLRYVYLLTIVRGSRCLKQQYSSTMENILQRLLKEDGLWSGE